MHRFAMPDANGPYKGRQLMDRRTLFKMMFGAAGAVLIGSTLGHTSVEAAVPTATPGETTAEIKTALEKTELDYAQYSYGRRRRVYRRRSRRPVYRRRVVRRRGYYRRGRFY